MEENVRNILNFWFKESQPKDWFKKDKKFDDTIKFRFFDLIMSSLNNELQHWKINSEGSLALIILLDQFTRNVFRGSEKSFSGDTMALEISLYCIKEDYLSISKQEWCHFFLIPMMHSEDLNIQNQSLPLFKKYTAENTYNFAVKHQKIISEFGRFPHRNIVLGRKSTVQELAFLNKPGSSF